MVTENTVSSILITGTADNDSIINFGDDVTIDSRSGNDTIYSGLDDQKADRVSINADEGNNIISIQGGSDSVTIRTGDGNNKIGSTSPNNAIFSGAGKDSIIFYTGADNNTLFSGDGDDVIQAVGHNVTIDAGGGNDKIRTFRNAYDITIKPGRAMMKLFSEAPTILTIQMLCNMPKATATTLSQTLARRIPFK